MKLDEINTLETVQQCNWFVDELKRHVSSDTDHDITLTLFKNLPDGKYYLKNLRSTVYTTIDFNYDGSVLVEFYNTYETVYDPLIRSTKYRIIDIHNTKDVDGDNPLIVKLLQELSSSIVYAHKLIPKQCNNTDKDLYGYRIKNVIATECGKLPIYEIEKYDSDKKIYLDYYDLTGIPMDDGYAIVKGNKHYFISKTMFEVFYKLV